MDDRFITSPTEDTINEVVKWFGFLPTDPIALDECDVDILVRDAKNVLLVTATNCDNENISSVINNLKSKAEELAPNSDFLKGKKYMLLFCYDPSGPCPWNGQNMMSELLKILPVDSDIIWGMSHQVPSNNVQIKIAATNLPPQI